MIIGRDDEIRDLRETVLEEQSSFIAVYGRRRVGKTFLIREAFNYRFTFQHAGLSEGSLAEQIFSFEASIKDAGGKSNNKRKNWLEAFEDLKDLIRTSQEKKKIIFIDELSWMDTKNSDLIPALENFWNGWASARKDIILIVCASATSWMMSKVIHNKGGLYNRLTKKIHLEPFSIGECEKYIHAKGLVLTRNQILQYYMIFGGVPFYWGYLKKGNSIAQNIDNILFVENAPLKDEFKYLYASIYRNPTVHLKIVEALGKKKVGMTRDEIIETTKLNNSGDLTTKLEELESCGFIRKYYSYGKQKKNALYQLIDNFTLFYYQFMQDVTSNEHFWSNQINTPRINTWYGYAFERVCLQHINQMKKKLGITGVHCEVNSWYYKGDKEKGIKGSQIDLLIVRNDQVINMCEMKYAGSEYEINRADDENIRRKIDNLIRETKTKCAIHPTIVTVYGLVDNAYAREIQSVITLDDLYEIEC